ncbi:MAG: hypothetical protein R3A78_05850 [Polyangiales bacterium]|nr:hypothetical protein [Myxococcales bacterium]
MRNPASLRRTLAFTTVLFVLKVTSGATAVLAQPSDDLAAGATTHVDEGRSPVATASMQIAGGVVGAAVAWLPVLAMSSGCGDYACATGAVSLGFFAGIAAPFMTAAGVYLVGEAEGGDASYWATLGGAAVAGFVAGGIFGDSSTIDDATDAELIAGISMGLLLPAVGALIGYMLSDDSGDDDLGSNLDAASRSRATSERSTLSIRPSGGPTADGSGGFLAIHGSF